MKKVYILAFILALIGICIPIADAQLTVAPVHWTTEKTGVLNGVGVTMSNLYTFPGILKADFTGSNYSAAPITNAEWIDYSANDKWTATFSQPVSNLLLYIYYWRGNYLSYATDPPSTYTFNRPFTVLSGLKNALVNGNSITCPDVSADNGFHFGIIQFSGTFNSLSVSSNAIYADGMGLTFGLPVPPQAPTALSATAVPSRAIKLHWRDNSAYEKGFLIETKDEAGDVTSTTVPANTTDYIVNGLQHNKTYTFQVRAFNDVGKSDPTPAVNARAQTYVLLVHGIYGNGTDYWTDMRQALEATNAGYHVDTINFSDYASTGYSNQGPIPGQGDALSDAITHILNANPNGDIDIVAHSMGGLAARWYLNNPTSDLWPLDAKGKPHAGVRKLITLGTPHWGTDVSLAFPVGTIYKARTSGSGDTITNWSSALRDMFAEWLPPPIRAQSGAYSYPDGYQPNMGKWPTLRSPMPVASCLLVRSATLFLPAPAKKAVEEALDQFPLTKPREQFVNHAAYYSNYVAELGPITYPAAQNPVEGVNTRRISQFMYDLNVASQDTSGAMVYMLAGTSGSFYAIVAGPYNAAFLNDGVVPIMSALGRSPIPSNEELYKGRPKVSLYLDHIGIYKNQSAINQVKLWLQQ